MHLREDGTLLLEAQHYRFVWTLSESGTASGRWWLEDGRFKGYIEASDIFSMKRGHSWSDEVLLVSDRDLILRNGSGLVEAYTRR